MHDNASVLTYVLLFTKRLKYFYLNTNNELINDITIEICIKVIRHCIKVFIHTLKKT